MSFIQTERLELREMDARDAAFTCKLLNTPKFIQYIGDRGVRTVDEAAAFIETRYRKSYRDHGYGLYTVALKSDGTQIGICGFVKRDTLPGPDIGFAFLPEFEGIGYAYEAAAATMKFGRESLGFDRVLAITSPDNDASGRLLEKLGFAFDKMTVEPAGEMLKLYSWDADKT